MVMSDCHETNMAKKDDMVVVTIDHMTPDDLAERVKNLATIAINRQAAHMGLSESRLVQDRIRTMTNLRKIFNRAASLGIVSEEPRTDEEIITELCDYINQVISMD